MIEIQLKDVAPRLEEGFRCLEDRKDEYQLPALFELEGAMKQRIHQRGQDSNNQRIGIKGKRKGLYSKGYEKLKRDGGVINGRQFAGAGSNLYPINLFVHGDLSRGYTTGKREERAVIAFDSTDARDKMAFAEENYNTEISRPTNQELEQMEDVLRIGIEEVLRDCFS